METEGARESDLIFELCAQADIASESAIEAKTRMRCMVMISLFFRDRPVRNVHGRRPVYLYCTGKNRLDQTLLFFARCVFTKTRRTAFFSPKNTITTFKNK